MSKKTRILYWYRNTYYLRLLLNVQQGCTTYEDLKNIKSVTHKTFLRCIDDRESIDGIIKAITFAFGPYIRRSFVSLLLSKTISKPLNVWEKLWEILTNDIFNQDKKHAYGKIVIAINHHQGGFFFVYGYGRIGKIVWKILIYKLGSKRKIVLNVTSSGIAFLLLTGDRPTYSQFFIPLSLNENSCFGIKQAFDRTPRDIMRFKIKDSVGKSFGGKVVLDGDFKQIFPIISHYNRAEIVMAIVNSLIFWKYYKKFYDWILVVGDGKLGSNNDGEAYVDILECLLVMHNGNPIENIVNSIYVDLLDNVGDFEYF
ncbi:hypothetical protein CR513_20764, partial [Mucuna pruriens]